MGILPFSANPHAYLKLPKAILHGDLDFLRQPPMHMRSSRWLECMGILTFCAISHALEYLPEAWGMVLVSHTSFFGDNFSQITQLVQNLRLISLRELEKAKAKKQKLALPTPKFLLEACESVGKAS